MKRSFCLTAAAAVVALSTASVVSAQQVKSSGIPGVDEAGMDPSVRPQDDFFRFVNGTWLDRTAIPSAQPR